MPITLLDDEKAQPQGGITLLDDSGQPSITALDDGRSLTGGEIGQFLAEDPSYARRMSIKDYEEYRRYKADNPITTDAIGQALGKVGQDLGDAAGAIANNITSPAALVEALARGTVTAAADTGDLIDKIITFDHAPDTYDLYRAKTGKGDNAATRKSYDELLQRDFSAFQESQDYQGARKGVVEGSPIPAVTEASTYFMDPSMLAPGAGAAKIGSIADRAIGAALRVAGEGSRLVTKPVVETVERAAKLAGEVAGPAGKGALAGTGLTGAVLGVPGVRETVGGYAALKSVDKAAEVAAKVGESLMSQPGRIGPLEAMGRVPNAGAIDRAIGRVGRLGGDAAIDLATTTAGGALTGAAIGGGLGYLADGEEGLYGGIGSGLALGALGAAVGRTVEHLKGTSLAEARAADLARLTEAMDEPTRKLFKGVVDRDGADHAVTILDGAALWAGRLEDGKATFLDDAKFKERTNANARGVFVDNQGTRPEIIINVDKVRSAHTFAHELFHAFDAVEQLRPQAEAIKQEIVGTFMKQPDGTMTQVRSGMLTPDQIEVAFKQYQRKAASSGVVTRDWYGAKTLHDKAQMVAGELGSEYMARMITGGDVDGLLRGYDGLTRTLLDSALIKQTDGAIRSMAERIGLGAAPAESMLFKNLKPASPTLNAMLRDLVRARRNLSERMVLAETTGEYLHKKDINNPAIGEKLEKMGLAERRPDGTRVMKPDDVLSKEDRQATESLIDVVKKTPVVDTTKPHLRIVDEKLVGGGISPEQIAAIQAHPGMSNKVKESLAIVADSLKAHATAGAGNVLFIEYGAALRRVLNRLTGKYTSKYSSGIRLTQREVAPYHLYVSDAGNLVVKAVDVSKLRTTATDMAARGKLGAYGDDINGFLSDVVRYFDNISDPSGVRTKDLPGMTPEKAAFLNQEFGSQEKGGAKYIRDFRLDRVTEMRPTGERIAASELAWQRQKVNWMPSENLPEGKVTNSNEGFRIVSRNGKHALYGLDGQRVGVYDSQMAAERRAQFEDKPVRKREDEKRPAVVPESDPTTEPGTPAPDTPVKDLPTEGEPIKWDYAGAAQFMPEVDRSAYPTLTPELRDRILNDTDTIAGIHIDRMRVGSYKGIDLQGGMFYPAIKENLAKRVVWAFNSPGVARTVAERAMANGGYQKLILMQEGNVIGNRTFAKIWFHDLRENIAAGKITERNALQELNSIRHKFARHEDSKLRTDHVGSWRTLDAAEKDISDMPQMKRASTYFQKAVAVTKAGEKMSYQSLLSQKMTALGFPDAIGIVNAIEEPAFKGVPKGAVVGILRFDPIAKGETIRTASDLGVPEHTSYKYVLTGQPVAKMSHFTVVDQKFPDVRNRIMSQQHTDFPVREAIPVEAGAAHGTINFMPEHMPNGTVYRGDMGFSVVNANGGKFRVYSPVGTLLGVAKSLEESQKLIQRHLK